MALARTRDGASGHFLTEILEGLTRGLSRIAETNSRIREVERLQAKSDSELARMGLNREGITMHVFRDVSWL